MADNAWVLNSVFPIALAQQFEPEVPEGDWTWWGPGAPFLTSGSAGSSIGTIEATSVGGRSAIAGSQSSIGTIGGSAAGGRGALAGTQSQSGVEAGFGGGGRGAITGTQAQNASIAATGKSGSGQVAASQSQSGPVASAGGPASGQVAGTESQAGTVSAQGSAQALVNGSQSQLGAINASSVGGESAIDGDIEQVWETWAGTWDDQTLGWDGDSAPLISDAAAGQALLDGTLANIGAIAALGPAGQALILGIALEVGEMIKLLRLAKLQEDDPASLRIAIEEITAKLNEVIRNLNPLLP